MTERKIAYNCRYFLGDRPCVWHKKEGSLCECEHYEPVHGSLLIIKLDAMGDVLRTTCLLPVITNAWPGTRISWITHPESVPLLKHNPYLTEVIPYGTDAVIHVSSQTFDRVINLDAGKTSAVLATMTQAAEKIGYTLHDDGHVMATIQQQKSGCAWVFLTTSSESTQKPTKTLCVLSSVCRPRACNMSLS